MKNIVFKVHNFPKLSETFIVNQVIIALKLGYKPTIIAKEFGHFGSDADTFLFKKHQMECMVEREDYKIPSSKFMRLLVAVLWVLRNYKFVPYLVRFYRILKKYNFQTLYQFIFYSKFRRSEIIHIQFGTNKFPIDVLKSIGFLKGKVITSFHGHDLHFPINGFIKKEGYYNLLFRTSNILVVNTPYLETKLLEAKAPEKKIEVLPVTVDTDFFQPRRLKRKDGIIRLITVGRLENLKGQKRGIECVKKLVEKEIEVQYYLIGEGSETNNLANLISEYGLSSNVFLLGSKSPLEVRDLLISSDIFLMTSITDPEFGAESQGLVTSEAQACGLPVIAFNTGGVQYTMLDGVTGFLCEEDDLEKYLNKLLLLIQNEGIRKRMGKHARSFVVDNFSHQVSLKRWKSIYEKILVE